METKEDLDISSMTLPSSQELPLCHKEWKTLHELFPQSYLHNQTNDKKGFAITVRLSISGMDFKLTFSLAENYPYEVPDISLSSRALSKTEIGDVLKPLDLLCLNSTGQPMLVPCIEETINLLQTLKIDERSPSRKKHRRKKKYNKESDTSDEEEASSCTDAIHNTCSSLDGNMLVKTVTNDVSKSESRMSRPNYFVAIRVWDESLIKNLVSLQNALVEQEILLTKGTIPTSSLHITLCNLGLDRADDLLRAMEVLRKIKSTLQSVLPKSPLVIHSASQFYDRAIYAKVKPNEEFLAFRDVLIKALHDCGIEFREDHENYTPHVTVIKVRRPERRMFGNRPIPPRIYSSFLETVHGEQIIDAIYLCAMDGNKREDGFYVTPYEVKFDRQLCL